MRKAGSLLGFFTGALALVLAGCDAARMPTADAGDAPREAAVIAADDALARAIREHAQGAQVSGRGVVARLLRDDREGSPHQKFLLRLDDGTTVLVAHNIDIAPRLDGLGVGDTVEFRGEYLWNPKGGTLHWTHRDPRGRHPDGALRWQGRTYD